MTAPVLSFDLETIPDVAGLRRLRPEWAHQTDAEVVEQAFAERRAKTGSDFLPLHLHRIVAIGCAFRDHSGFQVRCLGKDADDEAKLIQDFFRVIDKHTPQLVSWNGGGFDLPVLHYRAMIHGVVASRYFEGGDEDREFRYNNYLSRYHHRHTDLMDVLAMFQGRAAVPLDELAKLSGFAGKLGMSGDKVWPAFMQGQLNQIRAYCETDVVNTYLLYCRYQLMRGQLDATSYETELALIRQTLGATGAEHWVQFLAAWQHSATEHDQDRAAARV